MVSGHYPLENVMLAVGKQARKQLEYAWKKLQNDMKGEGLAPTSMFSDESSEVGWDGPSCEDIISGIAFTVFLDVVLPEGKLFAKKPNGQLSPIADPEVLFLDIDPPITPTAIRRSSGALSFAEFRPEIRLFAFVDPSDWRVRQSPRLDNCQSEEECEEIRANWINLADFAGSKLHFQSSVGFGKGQPISPSQIAQRCRAAIETIILGKTPRSNSALFQRFVVEAAQHLALRKPTTAPVEKSALNVPLLKDGEEEIKLDVLSSSRSRTQNAAPSINVGFREASK